MTYISGGTTKGFLRLTAPTTTPALSVAGEGRIYFDGTQFQASQNGAAYTPVVGGGGGGGGWTDDGTVVRLTTVTDGVGIGTATPAASSKLEVLGDATRKNVLLTGGTGVGVDQPGGSVTITGGSSTGAGLAGAITLTTGLPEDTSGNVSGDMTIATGDTSVMTNNEGSGAISLLSGGAAGTSGSIEIATGDAAGGNTGLIQIATGGGTAGSSGDISLTTGSPAGSSGSIFITVGNAGGIAPCGGISISTPGGYSAGDISISSGKGAVSGGGSLVLSGGQSLVLRTPDILIGETTANVIVLTGDAAGVGEQTGSISLDVGVATGGATPGQINIGMTNPTTVNIGGTVNIAGIAGTGSNTLLARGSGQAGDGVGGFSEIRGGDGGATDGEGGGAFATGGTGAGAGTGGAVQLRGGQGGPTNGEGGGVLLDGGLATGNATGGAIQAIAGTGGTTGFGGGLILRGGAGGSTSGDGGSAELAGGIPIDGNGGDVSVLGGPGVGSNRDGGSISLIPGDGTGTGTFGSTILRKGVSLAIGAAAITATTSLTGADDPIARVDTSASAAFTLTLPPAASLVAGRWFVIKDVGGNATAQNITIDGDGGETIDGAATFVLNTNYESVMLFCDGTNWFSI